MAIVGEKYSENQDQRILYLLSSLSHDKKGKLLKSLEKQNSPPFVLLPRIFLTSNANERKLFKYSLSQDKYIQIENRIPATYDKLFPLGIDRYLYREEEQEGRREFYLVEGRKKRLVLTGVETLHTIQNGYYFAVYQGDEGKWQLLDSNFELVEAFEPESYYITSNERYLVLERAHESLIIYDMETEETLTLSTDGTVSSAFLIVDRLMMVLTTVAREHIVMFIDLDTLHRTGTETVGDLYSLRNTLLSTSSRSISIEKVSRDLMLSHEASLTILWRFENGNLTQLQEIREREGYPSRVCDNLFIFARTRRLWRVRGGGESERASLFANFGFEEDFFEYLYPTREDVREVSKTLQMQVPNEVKELIVGFCAELIDPDE